MRAGILGGAFNPPHLGHLVCAQQAYEALGLGVVRFVPVSEAPHRELEGDPGAHVRARLCEAAVAGDPRFEVSRAEIERGGTSYTIDTLRQFAEAAPADELVLVLGADQASRLAEWREPEEVLRLATVAVAARAGMEHEAVLRRLDGLAGRERIELFDMPRLDISSTLVRGRAAAGLSLRYLVPDRVAALIEAEGLYPAAAAVPR